MSSSQCRVYSILTFIVLVYLIYTLSLVNFNDLPIPNNTPSDTHNIAVVSLLSFDSSWYAHLMHDYKHYVTCAVKLARSIRKTSQVQLVLLIVDSSQIMSHSAASHLQHAGWRLVFIHAISSPASMPSNRYDTSKMFSKLYLWNLTQFSAVLYVDLDTIFLRGFEALFSMHVQQMRQENKSLGMVRDSSHMDVYNAGVMLILPNRTLFDELKKGMNHYRVKWSAEQYYLNLFFQSNIYTLPSEYNVHISDRQLDDSVFHRIHNITIMHYIAKPWMPSECTKQNTVFLCAMWHKW